MSLRQIIASIGPGRWGFSLQRQSFGFGTVVYPDRHTHEERLRALEAAGAATAGLAKALMNAYYQNFPCFRGLGDGFRRRDQLHPNSPEMGLWALVTFRDGWRVLEHLGTPWDRLLNHLLARWPPNMWLDDAELLRIPQELREVIHPEGLVYGPQTSGLDLIWLPQRLACGLWVIGPIPKVRLPKTLECRGSVHLEGLGGVRALSGITAPGQCLTVIGCQDLERIDISNGTKLVVQSVAGFQIQGALNITEDERMIFSYRRRLIYTLAVGALICAVFGGWATHRGLKPLRSIAESTRGITAQRLWNRLEPGAVPQELRELVRALNDMLDRLDHAFSRLSQFSADLAHELRTPITNLMGEAEVTLSRERPVEEYRQTLESSLDEFRRLSRLISRMLFLARVEDPQTAIARVPVDAQKLVDEVLAYFEATAEEQGIALQSEVTTTLHGDADMLRQALANLVSNALEATPPGGRIHIAVRSEGPCVLLTVQDSGCGIPVPEIPHLLDRFYRTRETHNRKAPGTGLGLAIVRSIARLHGGDVGIVSEVGKGTTISMHFPTT